MSREHRVNLGIKEKYVLRIEVDEHYCLSFHEPADQSGSLSITVCLTPKQMRELFDKIANEYYDK